jgi:hypothetical protein
MLNNFLYLYYRNLKVGNTFHYFFIYLDNFGKLHSYCILNNHSDMEHKFDLMDNSHYNILKGIYFIEMNMY